MWFATVGSLLAIAAPSRSTPIGSVPAKPTSPGETRDVKSSSRLAFEANQGQFDSSVRFASRDESYALALTDRGARLALHDPDQKGPDLILGLEPVGASLASLASPTASERLPGTSSYLRGQTQRDWVVGAPRFARVTYPDAFPGVDLVFHGEDGRVEYDFVLAPGAAASSVQLDVSGADALSIDRDGSLLIYTRLGILRQPPPTVYQDDARGDRQVVPASYRLVGQARVAFDVAPYDATRPLVIDPVLLYSTYLGGSSFDKANAVAVDASGNVYLAGFTASPDFPTQNAIDGGATIAGSADVFVAKLDPTGTTLLYATYIGGSAEDIAYGIAVDASGSAYVTGSTESTDFPVPTQPEGGACPALQCANAGAANAFVLKLAPDGGSLVYATYLGGSAFDSGQAIALDASGSAYVAGLTQSPDFPLASAYQSTLNGTQNAFVAALSASGALVGATYLGGSANDAATAIVLDGSGTVYVAGYTQSQDFPTKLALQGALAGAQNAFVAALSLSPGTLAFSTYLGGSGTDIANALAGDSAGNVLVAGSTSSGDFPITTGVYQASLAGPEDAFVAKLAAGHASYLYSTFLGGSGSDSAAALAVDPSGNAYVVGQTQSVNFPVRGAFQTQNAAPGSTSGNAFVAILNAEGASLLGASYLGGGGGSTAQATALAPGNVAWVAGSAGAGFPTKSPLFGSFKAQTHAGQNAFLALVSPEAGVELDAGLTLDAPDALPTFVGDASANQGVAVVAPPLSATPVVAPSDATDSSGGGCQLANADTSPPWAVIAILLPIVSQRRRRASSARAA